MGIRTSFKTHLGLSPYQLVNGITFNLPINLLHRIKVPSGRVPIKEIEVPKHVGDMIEYWLNKVKEAGNVRNNITIVEPYSAMPDTKKIMITNLNLEKIRKIKDVVEELMESSDSESDEDWDNFLDSIIYEE